MKLLIETDEIGIGTDNEKLLFYIKNEGESLDILAAGDSAEFGDYGMLAITPLSSRRLTVHRFRRNKHREDVEASCVIFKRDSRD
jgi:hypothetical protein